MFLHNTSTILKTRAAEIHGRTPGLRKLPFSAIAIIVFLVLINIAVWIGVGIVLVEPHLFHELKKVEADCPFRISIRKFEPSKQDMLEGVWANACLFSGFTSTAVLAYTLGLRHALDADHISVRFLVHVPPFGSCIF